MRRYLLALALCLPVALVSCAKATTSTPAPINPDAGLQKVVDALKGVQVANRAVQDTVIEANAQGRISVAVTGHILNDVCAKVNAAALQSLDVTEGLSKLAPEQRGKLTTILNPVIAAVKTDVQSGLITIPDAATRQKVTVALAAVQTILDTIQAVIQ